MNDEVVSYKNQSGCQDPTAHDAIVNVINRVGVREQDEVDIRALKAIKAIRLLLDVSGFTLLRRLEIQDQKTGKVYR